MRKKCFRQYIRETTAERLVWLPLTGSSCCAMVLDAVDQSTHQGLVACFRDAAKTLPASVTCSRLAEEGSRRSLFPFLGGGRPSKEQRNSLGGAWAYSCNHMVHACDFHEISMVGVPAIAPAFDAERWEEGGEGVEVKNIQASVAETFPSDVW